MGMTHDISTLGIGIFSDHALEIGPELDIRICVADEGFQTQVVGKVVYCQENPHPDQDPSEYLVGVHFTRGPLVEMPSVDQKKEPARYTPFHTAVVNAPAKRCYELIYDFERYPDWAAGMKSVHVLDRYPDGRGKKVEFVYNFIFRKVCYVMNYAYDDENYTLSFVNAGGDDDVMMVYEVYSFRPEKEDLRFSKYELDVTLSVRLSQRIARHITSVIMRREMHNFNKFVEGSL